MPWNKKDVMSLKEEFIAQAIENQRTISQLCREFKISRKTGYKWLLRYKEEGIDGLQDLSRRPCISPTKTDCEKVNLILKIRNQFPAWGARKLRQFLVDHGHEDLPCEATFNRILYRHGKIDLAESRRRQHFIRFEHPNPNDLWQMDFKGHFQIPEGRCHPLTILDDHSRFNICLKALQIESYESVRSSLEEAFREYGLPARMTMDNGAPWHGSPPIRFSRLTIWLMRIGIIVSHSRPYHPQTQGKDERFHRTFKEEVLKFQRFKNLLDAQLTFDEWREVYNNLRPHEAISMKCPRERYRCSIRKYRENLAPIDYSADMEIRKVRGCGKISYKGKEVLIGEYLSGEYVGVRQVKEKTCHVFYYNTKITSIYLE